ncbi:MAG: glycoside hydrolase family 2 protein [Acidobacteriaceae bacterium]
MRRSWLFALVCLLAAGPLVFAQEVKPLVLVDVDNRVATSLDGPWHYMADPYRNGWGGNPEKPDLRGYARDEHFHLGGPLVQYDFAKSPVMMVPGAWNTQNPKLDYYEGLLWYERQVRAHPVAGKRYFLHFGAANYQADVFVNDQWVCEHKGGFTSFSCEVTGALRDGANSVVVAVDDTRKVDRVPTLKYDWWNYGGLTRDVSLVAVPRAFIDDEVFQLQRSDAATDAGMITGYVHVDGAGSGVAVRVRIPGLKVDATARTDAEGRAAFAFRPEGLVRWSPRHPRLYRVEMTAGQDNLTDEIGFRTVEVRGTQILLNGKPVFLRGIDIQGEAPYRGGPSNSEKDVATLLGWAKELHCNYVRLVHYPHDEKMLRLADKMGIMVWSEIPVYWGIDWTDAGTLAEAKDQLHAMIRRDDDRASVILWSLSNETPYSEARDVFLAKLAKAARAQDSSRLITSAIVTHFHGKTAVLDDPLGKSLDVLGYNEYIGWYGGTPESAPEYTWEDPMGKPVIISEFGAGAKAGLHGSATEKFTEEYQAEVYREQFQMFAKIPFLTGLSPWVLMDFRSPLRPLPGIQDGYNRKGLVSNMGVKKRAFFVLQKYYAGLAAEGK